MVEDWTLPYNKVQSKKIRVVYLQTITKVICANLAFTLKAGPLRERRVVATLVFFSLTSLKHEQ